MKRPAPVTSLTYTTGALVFVPLRALMCTEYLYTVHAMEMAPPAAGVSMGAVICLAEVCLAEVCLEEITIEPNRQIKPQPTKVKRGSAVAARKAVGKASTPLRKPCTWQRAHVGIIRGYYNGIINGNPQDAVEPGYAARALSAAPLRAISCTKHLSNHRRTHIITNKRSSIPTSICQTTWGWTAVAVANMKYHYQMAYTILYRVYNIIKSLLPTTLIKRPAGEIRQARSIPRWRCCSNGNRACTQYK